MKATSRVSYQLDFMTPGISPLRAMFRKQIRQIPNFRRKALDRPQMGHRLYRRVENFGLLFALAIRDFFATFPSLSVSKRHSQVFQ